MDLDAATNRIIEESAMKNSPMETSRPDSTLVRLHVAAPTEPSSPASCLPLLLLAMLLWGCTGARRPLDSIELVPATSRIVLALELTALRGDECLCAIMNPREIEDTLRRLGVNPDDVLTVTVFADDNSAGQPSAGYIFSGTFSAPGVIKTLRNGGWTHKSYRGLRYVASPSGSECALPTGRHVLVLTTPLGVQDLERAMRDPDERLVNKQPYSRIVERFQRGACPVFAVISFPEVVSDVGTATLRLSSMAMDFAGLGSIGTLLTDIGAARGTGYSIVRRGQFFDVELAGVMQNEEAAGLIAGGFGMLKGLGTLAAAMGGSQSDPAAMEQVNRISASRDGEVVYIAMQMTESELRR